MFKPLNGVSHALNIFIIVRLHHVKPLNGVSHALNIFIIVRLHHVKPLNGFHMRSTFFLPFVFSMFKPLNGVSHALNIFIIVRLLHVQTLERGFTCAHYRRICVLYATEIYEQKMNRLIAAFLPILSISCHKES